MDAKAGLMLLQLGAGVVVIIAGGLSWYLTDKEAKRKESKHQEQMQELLERARGAETAFDQLNAETKGVRELIAQRYPGADLNEALERLRKDLAQELRDTRDLATRDQYRPLEGEIKAEMIQRLRGLAGEANERGVVIHVYSKAHRHSDTRTRLLEDMRDALLEAGLEAKVAGEQIRIGGNVGNPVAIGFHPENRNLGIQLAEILQPLIGRPLPATVDEKFKVSEIQIKVSGQPEFDRDGRVTIR